MDGFQHAKLVLLDLLPLSRDGFHIYLGLIAYLVAASMTRRPLGSWRLLAVPLALGIVLEVPDLSGDLETFGHPRWGASVRDVINTVLAPVAVIAIARQKCA